jgi:uncharacterized protein
MTRPVLMILMLLAGWWWLSRQGVRNARPTSSGPSAPSAGRAGADQASTPQPIEQCDVCGVHAPRAGMVALSNGRYRCAEHAAQAPHGGRGDA